MARVAEAAGFDACNVTDHPFPAVARDTGAHHAWDPFALLAALAAATTTVRLHTSVLVLPYRNPFLVASQATTVDHISNGRLILGLGAGFLASEFAALGASIQDRGSRMDDSLVAMQAAWTGEPLTLSGRGWVAAGNSLPAPIQRPHPPLWIAGNSGAAMRRAVVHGQGWSPVGMSAAAAGASRTAPMDSVAALERRLAECRRLAEAENRQEPLDICLVRAGWGRPDADPTAADVERVAELEALGVSWYAIRVEGDSPAAITERIMRWADALGL